MEIWREICENTYTRIKFYLCSGKCGWLQYTVKQGH